MSVRSQAQATSTKSAVDALTHTQTPIHLAAMLHSHQTIDKSLLFPSENEKKKNTKSAPVNRKKTKLKETEITI